MTREELLPIAKPILFNTEMVQAILEGRKTVTRRVIKPKHKGASGIKIMGGYVYDVIPIDFIDGQTQTVEYQRAPYEAGDYLYVRETWTDPTPEQSGYPILYMADMPMRWEEDDVTLKAEDYKWKPSIHMPKEAARIFLKIMHVRVERLQDMETADDSNYKKEGAKDKHDFIGIWNSTTSKANNWYANPWVWVIEFEKVEV